MGDQKFTPLFIIGAPRSGTNILRDALCEMPEFATWDCDEINPVFRHGHISWPNDRFTSDMADTRSQQFLRSYFNAAWRRFGCPRFLVEKTCANSLRVEYLNTIFPDARFVFIHRDGFDVVGSAQKRWRGELELPSLPYYWAKIRNTPFADLPVYGWRFLVARIGKALGKSDRLASWGPQYPGMQTDLMRYELDEVCALQWSACVQAAIHDFSKIDSGRVFAVSYEHFVSAPQQTLESLLNWLEEPIDAQALAAATQPVRAGSVGQGRRMLEANGRLSAIEPLVSATNRMLDTSIR